MFQTETSILALYGLLVMLVILVQSGAGTLALGLPYLAGARDEGRSAGGVAGRLIRTVDNSVVALALFAPAALLVKVSGASTPSTVLACQVFFGCRVAYAAVYPLGVPYLRTLVWAGAFFANAWLYVQAVG